MDNYQLTAAVDALRPGPPDEDDCGLAARFTRRHGGDDPSDLLAALGLDGAAPPVKCGTCGYKRTSKNHQVMCA